MNTKMKMHQFVIAVAILCYCANATAGYFAQQFGSQPVSYGNPALDRVSNVIQAKYVDASLAEIVSKSGTKEDLVTRFKIEISGEENVEDELTDEEATDRECMQEIQKIAKNGSSSGTKLKIVALKGDVVGKFNDKEKALAAQRDGLYSRMVLSGCVAFVGSVVLAGGVIIPQDTIHKIGVGLGGGVVGIAGGCYGISTYRQRNSYQTGIDATRAQRDSWKRCFKK